MSFVSQFMFLRGFAVLLLLTGYTLKAVDRVTEKVDDQARTTLPGHVSPQVRSAQDQGPVDPGMAMPYLSIVFKPSAAQQADLARLASEQQDPHSPNYHVWLTPEQYGDRFGASRADIGKIKDWLASRHLAVKSIARGRNAIVFGGAAADVAAAFETEIHHYQASDGMHYSNASDPSVPAAFRDVVRAIHGLSDFRLKPMLSRGVRPRDDWSSEHVLAPDDIATIYDIAPLYKAGIDGSGQNLVVVGEAVVQMSDIQNYRSHFNLPANNPTTLLVPNSQAPGSGQDELAEADLDLELSGAIARNANIQYVYTANAIDALQYAIDQILAPVVSISYGVCELQTPASEVQVLETWGAQANAQGQTIFASAGDNGALDCSGGGNPSTNNRLSVDLPAALPQVTGVGGTTFSEGSGSYWSSTNTANSASALSYIPETTWNDGVCGKSVCAGGGGASANFTKPSWQTGAGVPGDGFRDVPDVALAASPNHDGYIILSGGKYGAIGGTSAGAPAWAGIALLLNHYLIANGYQSTQGLGNINPALYQNLAPLSGIFHDIASGTNMVPPCSAGGCSGTPVGYTAGPGYDQVTGLGTPDVNHLVTAWHNSGITAKYSVAMTLTANPARAGFTDTTTLTASMTPAGGGSTTGTVTYLLGSETLGTVPVDANGSASLTIGGVLLAVGPNTIQAQYNGDNSHYGASASVRVTESSPSNGLPSVASLENSASFTPAFAPGGIVSIFGNQLAAATSLAPTLPLPAMMAGLTVTINGYPAPLYYVSPTQLNVQIPYEVPANSTASVRINNNSESAFDSFPVSAAAPAIFSTNSQGSGQGAILDLSYKLVDASNPATPGVTYLQIYCMGLGAVSNAPADGAPAGSSPLSNTVTRAQVTIGGVTVPAAFSGLAPGFVGLYQVNVQVPASVTSGSAVPVVVSIGGAQSNTVTIAVQ